MATRPTDRRWNDLIMKLVDLGRLGQKSGAGLVSLRQGQPHAAARSRRRAVHRRGIQRAGDRSASRSRDERDHQALPLRHDQRRREAPRAGHRPAAERHRHRLRHRLRLPCVTTAGRCTTPTGSGWRRCWPTSGASMRSTATGGNPRRCWSAWWSEGKSFADWQRIRKVLGEIDEHVQPILRLRRRHRGRRPHRTYAGQLPRHAWMSA